MICLRSIHDLKQTLTKHKVLFADKKRVLEIDWSTFTDEKFLKMMNFIDKALQEQRHFTFDVIYSELDDIKYFLKQTNQLELYHQWIKNKYNSIHQEGFIK